MSTPGSEKPTFDPLSAKLTQRLTLHLNGGSDFSERHTAIMADGQETGISLHERTDGSPDYHYTARELHYGQEMLDLMQKEGPEPMKWIRDRLLAVRYPDEQPQSKQEAP